MHSVSAWASELGLSLGQVACAEKSSEITAIPEHLRLVDIQEAIVTIDAIGTRAAHLTERLDRPLADNWQRESIQRALTDVRAFVATGHSLTSPAHSSGARWCSPRGFTGEVSGDGTSWSGSTARTVAAPGRSWTFGRGT